MAELGFWILLLISWTLVIRVFPSILGKAFEKSIEHRYDRNLERIKAELQAYYSTLKTSVDFLSTAQSELRTKVIASTETLWHFVCAVEKDCGRFMFVDALVLPNEIDEVLSGERDNRSTLDAFKACSDLAHLEKNDARRSIESGVGEIICG